MPRPGFSIEETLVVIAVVTLALSLALPVVARARRAAGASRCVNNLRQLGLAAHHHAGRTGAFPAGALPLHAGAGTVPLGWQARLLDEVDQQRLTETADFAAGFDAPANAPLTRTPVDSYSCPADPAGAWGSYAGMRHHRAGLPAETDSGLLIFGRAIPPDAAYDGLSNTLLCGEKRSDVGRWGGFAVSGWAAGDAATLRTAQFPPGPHPGKPPATGFRGHHDLGGPAACLFSVADGAVRPVAHGVDRDVFRRLAHRADGALPPTWLPTR